MHVRKDDMVVVITGDDADPKRPRKVLRVLREKNKILVEGVNKVYKHLKRRSQQQQGGRLSREMPISVSNVLLYCPTCAAGVRMGRRYLPDGRKERFCKKCSGSLGTIGSGKGRPAYAARPEGK